MYGQGTGSAAPCPRVELPCEASGEGEPGEGEEQPCPCGPGDWFDRVILHQSIPSVPTNVDSWTMIGMTYFGYVKKESTADQHAQARIELTGKSYFWDAGSYSIRAFASLRHNVENSWIGTGPPCARQVNLSARGGATLLISASCAARLGCTASASATGAGNAESKGNASAELHDLNMTGHVGYNAVKDDFSVDGNFGAALDYESPSITGSFSRQVNWSTDGVGSHSGTASYSVRSGRTWCAWTNRPVTRKSYSTAGATAAGSVDENGSCAASARSDVSLYVN